MQSVDIMGDNSAFPALETYEIRIAFGEECELQTSHSPPPPDSGILPDEQDTSVDVRAGDSKKVAATICPETHSKVVATTRSETHDKHAKSFLFSLSGDRSKLWRHVELGVLAVLVVVVWGLLFLPFIFYHIPDDEPSTVVPVCVYWLIRCLSVYRKVSCVTCPQHDHEYISKCIL